MSCLTRPCMPVLWLLVLLLIGGAAPTPAAPAAEPAPASDVTFTNQVQLGNIFTLGETVQIEAAAKSSGSVAWTVTDCEGAQVAAGTAAVKDGVVRFAPGTTGKGYYSVFVAPQGGQTARTSYAVVPAFDLSKMGDSRFGIQTHFAQNMPLDFLPLLAKAGIGHVRDEQYWAHVEKTKGTFDFSAFEGYMDALKACRITPLICMTFGNPLYDHQLGPNHKPLPAYKLAPWNAELYEAYANYCVEVLKHYGDQINAVEIWNEYNGGSFIAGEAAKNKFKTYTEMCKVAYQKIKAARPDVQVLGAATVKIPIPYLDKLFQQGALRWMDAVAVHPYVAPDEAEQSLARLADLMRKVNQGEVKPIWCTEYGYARDASPERAEAAQHLVKTSVCILTQPAVARMYWYLSRDYPPNFPTMGILHDQRDPMGPLTPVMSYPAYANLISLLDHAVFKEHVQTDVRTRLYRFDKERQQVWIAWSSFEKTALSVAASRPVTRINLTGGETQLAPVGGKLTLPLDELPVYIVADNGTVSAISEVPRRDVMIADAASEFTGPDVTNSWSYWFFANNRAGSAPYDPDKAQPMQWTPSPGDWDDIWSGPGKWFTVGAGSAQPNVVSGGQGWAIRRWTSTVDGPVHVLAKISTAQQGDGCGFLVFIDGQPAYSKLLPAKQKDTLDLSPVVHKGTRIDFIATPGPATDANYDVAGFRIQILTLAK